MDNFTSLGQTVIEMKQCETNALETQHTAFLQVEVFGGIGLIFNDSYLNTLMFFYDCNVIKRAEFFPVKRIGVKVNRAEWKHSGKNKFCTA